jgi:hypothetical protein
MVSNNNGMNEYSENPFVEDMEEHRQQEEYSKRFPEAVYNSIQHQFSYSNSWIGHILHKSFTAYCHVENGFHVYNISLREKKDTDQPQEFYVNVQYGFYHILCGSCKCDAKSCIYNNNYACTVRGVEKNVSSRYRIYDYIQQVPLPEDKRRSYIAGINLYNSIIFSLYDIVKYEYTLSEERWEEGVPEDMMNGIQIWMTTEA